MHFHELPHTNNTWVYRGGKRAVIEWSNIKESEIKSGKNDKAPGPRGLNRNWLSGESVT